MISAAEVWSYTTRTLTSPVFGDLVTKNLAHILSDSVAFKGAFIDVAISSRSSHSASDVWAVGVRTLTSPVFGDLVTKNITDILSDSVAFAGADIAAIKADTAAILVDTASILSGISSILVDTAAILVDTSTLLTRLSAARAGYLDNLSGGAVALASVCTEVRLAHLDADISSRSSHSAADVWAVASRTLTSPVFGDLVTKNLTAILSDSVAFKGADIATILSEIQNATYGLSALETLVDEVESLLKNGAYGLSALRTVIDSVNTRLDHATYGLGALHTHLESCETKLDSANNALGLVTGYTDEIESLLKNATYGLSALNTDLDGIISRLDNATYGLSALDTDLGTLLTRLTATRAGYLDNLSGGAVALESGGNLAAVKTDVDNLETIIKFPSVEALDDIAVAVATNTTEKTVTVSVPTGATIRRVMLAAFITAMNNTANAQKIDVDVQGRLGAGSWNTYFSQDDCLGLPAADACTSGFVPLQDVSALVTGAGTYGFRCVITQSAAQSVRYTTQFLLIVTYRMS